MRGVGRRKTGRLRRKERKRRKMESKGQEIRGMEGGREEVGEGGNEING